MEVLLWAILIHLLTVTTHPACEWGGEGQGLWLENVGGTGTPVIPSGEGQGVWLENIACWGDGTPSGETGPVWLGVSVVLYRCEPSALDENSWAVSDTEELLDQLKVGSIASTQCGLIFSSSLV